MGKVADVADRVEGAAVDVAQLRADDDGARRPRPGPPTAPRPACRPWPSHTTGTTASVPTPRKRSARSIVPCRLSPASTRTIGAPQSPWAAASQPAAAQHLGDPDGEPGERRRLRSGDEADRGLRRQPEDVEDPAGGDLLDDGGRGAHRRQPRVLVPGRGQPVRGEGGRRRAADDEAEVPAAARRHDPGIGRPRQGGDDLSRVTGDLGQRPAQRRAQGVEVRGGPSGRVGRPSR